MDVELDLRKAVIGEEFDYPLLMSVLSEYASPRAKVTGMLRKGLIVRVKKGLYAFGPDLSRRPLSSHVLANLIYGPSCVSLQSALAHHNLIPERVAATTSVTPLRNKRFDTPAGRFTYRYLNPTRYSVGVDRQALADGTPYLIATPEKALADWLVLQPGHPRLSGPGDLRAYLIENLRLDEEGLAGLEPMRLGDLARAYRSQRVHLLARLAGAAGAVS
ncbi:MAG: hypothetical protein JRF33_15225 [Deltaproteobacteria bacterium]|nr:hypothetical protein [Deltaproteobacteria bacterium]